MLSLLNILIIFFILLIFYQLFLAHFNNSVIEGMMDVVPTISPTSSPTNEMLPNLTVNQVYRQYDKKISDNTFLLAQQNAGNIEYIKERIDDVQGMNKQLQDLSGNVQALQEQVDGLVQANQQYTSQMIGTEPPQISGAVENTSEDTSSSIDSVSNFVT
jgi:uncharacterized membrane protein